MADYRTLEAYKGWSIVWQPGTGRLMTRKITATGLFPPTHDFHVRPKSAGEAVSIGRSWIDNYG